MAVDSTNVLRVDIEDVINTARHRTELKSRALSGDAMAQQIVISDDDYKLLVDWIFEAAGKIANNANYIWNAQQTGLDAVSNPYVSPEENPNDEIELINLDTRQKQNQEWMSKDFMDMIIFSLPQLSGKIVFNYTFIQTMIRSAMIEYLLYMWYDASGMEKESQMAYARFDDWQGQIRFNSVSNIKNLNVSRRPRPLG